MPLDLQTADIIRGVRQRFGLRGSFTPTLDENVSPVVSMGDLDAAPWRDNGQRFYLVGGASQVAAQYGFVGLFNASSQDLMLVTGVYITSGSAMGYGVVLDTTARGALYGGGVVPELPTPSGAVTDSRVALYYGSQAAAPPAPNIVKASTPAAGFATISPLEVTIQPGMYLWIFGDTVNLSFTASWTGRIWGSR